MRRTWLLPMAVGAIAGAMTVASAASLTVTSKDLTVLSVAATPPPTGDTTPPVAVALTSSNSGGANDEGRPQSGDDFTITFDEPLDATKLCAQWANNGQPQSLANSSVVIRIKNNAGTTGGDRVEIVGTCGSGTLSVGHIDLGDSGYVSGDVEFGTSATPSSVGWDPATKAITVTLGAVKSGSGSVGRVSANRTQTYVPSTTVRDLAGNTSTGTYATSIKFF